MSTEDLYATGDVLVSRRGLKAPRKGASPFILSRRTDLVVSVSGRYSRVTTTMIDASDRLPDELEAEDRRPAACPFCGYEGAFDGQGTFTTEPKIIRRGVETQLVEEWYQARCGECGGVFRCREHSEVVSREETGL